MAPNLDPGYGLEGLLVSALCRLRLERLVGVDRHLDAPILLTIDLALVRRHRLGLSAPRGAEPRTRHALRHEIVRRRGRATLGERHVVAVGTLSVGMADDEQIGAWILVEARGERRQIRLRRCAQYVGVVVEQQAGLERHLEPL